MSELKIARTYAKSILELAKDQDNLDAIKADLMFLKEAFKTKDLFLLLKNPIIKGAKKKQVFNALFEGKLSPLTMAFLTRVITKGREALIPEMIESFIDQYNDINKLITVKLITAKELSDDVISNIKEKIKTMVDSVDQIKFNLQIDPSLIGGFVLDFGDRRYDASIKNKLEALKKSFS